MVHGFSGAVDVVSQKVVNYLQKFNKEGEFPPLDPETVDKLKKRGYLTDKTEKEEEEFVCALVRVLLSRARSTAKFLLIPTYNCQLRCPYCYEVKLRRKGSEWLEKTMTKETVDAAFQAMQKIHPERKKSEKITLYGGEPLMAQNVDVVTYMVRRGTELGYTFKCITNGLDLDKYVNVLGPGKIDFLQITLDGPQEVHDMRRFSEEGGTFSDITKNISLALRKGVQVVVRTNVDRKNVEHLWMLARFYNDMGWTQEKNFKAYCYPVHTWRHDRMISRVDLVETMAQQAQEHPEVNMIENDFGISRLFLSLIQTGKYPTLYPAYCGSNYGMYLLDPYGDVYLCWETVGTEGPHGKVGTYVPELSLDDDAVNRWQDRTVMNIPACRKCPYALLCGGGCGQRAYCRYGDLANPSCREFKELFKKIVPVAYAKWQREHKGGQIVSNN